MLDDDDDDDETMPNSINDMRSITFSRAIVVNCKSPPFLERQR